MKTIFVVYFFLILLSVNCQQEQAPILNVQIVETFPHDSSAFTEGLFFAIENGTEIFYEGTGLYGHSRVQKSILSNGEVQQSTPIPDQNVFGEGIVALQDQLYQLTWKKRRGFIYNQKTLGLTASFDFPPQLSEGWGMTTDGTFLIVSDGSHIIRYLNASTFHVEKSISVGDVDHAGRRVAIQHINELEYIAGLIFANIWQTKLVYAIDAETGDVVFILNCKDLGGGSGAREMNGIAYDSDKQRLFLTGKNWHNVFHVAWEATATTETTRTQDPIQQHESPRYAVLIPVLLISLIAVSLLLAIIGAFIYHYRNVMPLSKNTEEMTNRSEDVEMDDDIVPLDE